MEARFKAPEPLVQLLPPLKPLVHGSVQSRKGFRGVRLQMPNSMSLSALTEFQGGSSVSSLQPISEMPGVPSRTPGVPSRTEGKTILEML